MSNTQEDLYYEQVAQEIEQNDIKKGLWIKAYAECAGVESLVRAYYIKLRILNLAEEDKFLKDAKKDDERRKKDKERKESLWAFLAPLFVGFLFFAFIVFFMTQLFGWF